jgi:hypothetical protein
MTTPRTVVTTNASFAGEPVGADVAGMQSLLDMSLQSWLQRRNPAAESRV